VLQFRHIEVAKAANNAFSCYAAKWFVGRSAAKFYKSAAPTGWAAFFKLYI